ncbi:TonB-dependent receptor [Aliikangiella sp. IMCC44359]|uniref:TonB-dependent receptor n=1 Tax=Aliikangiella sp. IMCC44359 TaxID=3459125 RepID=UPI00403AB63D
MKSRIWASYLALLVMGQVPILQVKAEEIAKTGEEKEEDEGVLIITGSRVEESIDEVPASISVIKREQILSQIRVSSEVQNILANTVPGMAPGSGSSSNSTVTLRGRNALVMIDGVPQSTPLRNGALGMRTIDPEVLERVEVVKGATSVYGNGAAGGIINYRTKLPEKNKPLEAEVTLSSKFSTDDFDGSAGLRFNSLLSGTSDKFDFVLSATKEELGRQKDANGEILGTKYGLSDSESENYFIKSSYFLDDERSLQLTYNYYSAQQNADLVDVVSSINSDQPTYAVPLENGLSHVGAAQGPRGNTNLMVKYEDTDIWNNSSLTADWYQQTIENVFFYSPTLSNPAQGYSGGQSMIKSEKSGVRVLITSEPDWEDLDTTFIYGIDALNDITSQPLLDGRMWVPEMDMNNLAGFLQTKFVFDNNWIIKAGIRQEKIDLSVDDYATLRLCRDANTCSEPVNVTGGELNYRATTYNLGLRYNYAESFSPFFSYSQGADISDLGRLLRTATVEDINLIHTEASIIDHYELGFTSYFSDTRVEFAAYRSNSELGTTNKYDPATGIYLPIRAPQKIWGYELAVNHSLSDSLALTSSYSWVEGKNTSNDEYLGARQISPPKFTTQLNWQINDKSHLDLTYLFISDRKRFEKSNDEWVGDQGPVSSYSIVNLGGHIQFSKIKLFAGIENLFNKDYYPAKSQSYAYAGYNVKGLGRTMNLGVQYLF